MITARERMREAEASCDHVDKGICRDCCLALMIAHADAMKRDAVRVAAQWCRQGEAGAETASYIAAAIGCIEVT